MAGGSAGDLDSLTGLTGATDGTEIGNVSDRLKVDASVSLGVTPGDAVVWISAFLERSGSKDMAVNGSSTQKVFSQAPPAGQIWYLQSITLIMKDSGSQDTTDFGTLATLSNGIDVIYERNGTDYNLLVDPIKANTDIATAFIENDMNVSDTGWFDTDTAYRGTFSFPTLITLDGDTNDEIRFEINDDLSLIDDLCSRIKYMRVL